jgi:hypothetical protein
MIALQILSVTAREIEDKRVRAFYGSVTAAEFELVSVSS